MTHISYATAKAIKAFLGENLPDSMGALCYYKGDGEMKIKGLYPRESFPAYQLHDLLSKPFCEAMANKIKGEHGQNYVSGFAEGLAEGMSTLFYSGGLSAVEADLVRMMEGK